MEGEGEIDRAGLEPVGGVQKNEQKQQSLTGGFSSRMSKLFFCREGD
jgi:hypothetical protein